MNFAGEPGLEIVRVDAPFGIELRGLQWASPAVPLVAAVTRLLRRHLLIVLRGQASPTADQLADFFRPFGRLVSETIDGAFHDNATGSDEAGDLHWSSDQFQRPQLKVLSVVEAMDCEPTAEPTVFRDMYTAYEMLAPEWRTRLEFKQTINFDPSRRDPVSDPRLCDSMHPVFTPHPHSGRRALYVNDLTARIAGLEQSRSDELLGQLREHAQQNAPTYDHHWRDGDILVWDNVGVQHRGAGISRTPRRVLRAFEGVAE